uniref:Uncharacterized protein n=1 Tax=Escherichia coli TaxID=562 RepID=A0A6G8FBW8_ECOLX|nr:hypothetical protein p77_00079 [Escherichia coli]
MAKTKQEWLYQLRRCSSVNTLEKIIHKNRDSLLNVTGSFKPSGLFPPALQK